jgi:ribosomal protein L29
MKIKEKKQLKEKSLGELKVALKEAKSALFSLNLDQSQRKLKNTRSIFFKRKEIAVILTEINRKELNAENA